MNNSSEQHGDRQPSSIACSIIIPTRDMLNVLQPCVESVLHSTLGEAVEIVIVDNESAESETLDYLATVSEQPQVRVVSWPHPFNFSALNNFAVDQCRGEVVCFLNNDIEVIQDGWLEPLLALSIQKHVGAVGCLLIYGDNRIQHGGIALDQTSVAKHIAHKEAANYFALNGVSEAIEVDAVTGACLLIRRELFLQLGGFNEDDLAVAYNDVDLCMRLGKEGYSVLLHPGICHIHHESLSRKSDDSPDNKPRAQKEFDYMQSTWKTQLQGNQYSSGIPNQTSRAAESKYQSKKQSRTVNAGGSSAELQKLRLDNQALQDHIARIEEAHRLIEQSIFWRITAPLRSIRDVFRRKGNAVNEMGSQNESTAISPGIEAPDPKADYDRQAKESLAEFFANDSRLVFPEPQQAMLSIALVFYNQAHLSLLCLQSILKFAGTDFELIVVDNQSTDETGQLLDRLDNVKIQRNADNLGFVRAVNQAAELASGKYFLLLNNDALLEEDTLHAALSTLDSAPDIGAVGAKIKLLDGSLQEAGSIIWNDGACYGYGRGDDPEAPEYMMQRDVDYCSGAFLLLETALFKELGCFDEAFAPAYYEESDFCIRLHELGYRVVFEPNAQITHYEFASSGGISGATKLQQAHRKILCEKHAEYLSRRLENDPSNVLKARTANSHPNVLIIDDRVPYPSLGAGYPRSCHILEAASQLPLNLTFFPLLYTEEDWSDVYDLLPQTIEVILDRGQAGLSQFLRERQGFYQIIMVSRPHNMEIFNEIVKHDAQLISDEKIIYDAEAVCAPREVLRRRLWGEEVSNLEEAQLVAEELKQAATAHRVVAVSEKEASLYHQQSITDTIVLGHTLPRNPTPNTFSERNGILFVGALRDEGSPNVDSLLWFLINCWPTIEHALPSCELFVVGDNSVPSLATADRKNVKFLGRLDSIDEYYNKCQVFIAPTRFAAGIPHKVHEAASMGLPSVTTTLLAEQLGWDHGVQLLSTDDALEFAKQCIALCTDEELWGRVREAGLQAIAKDCSPDAFQAGLRDLFDVNES